MILLYLLTFLLILYQPTGAHGGAIQSCPTLCRCQRDTVDCSSRELTDVPIGIPNNTRILNLSDNEIDSIDDSRLPYLPALTTLDLSNNILRHLHGSLFKKTKHVRTLHLRKNRLTKVPNGISECKLLEKLDLRSNSISQLSINDFSAIAAIRHVDLSRNLISKLPHGKVTEEVVIEKLDIASNLLIDISSNSFLELQSLVSLRLSRNKILSLGKNTFSRLPYLETLDLSKNLIRTVHSLAFNSLPSLQNVTLSKNEIFRLDDGMFHDCDSLQYLNISMNRIQTVNEGWMFGLSQLQTLDLSNNHILSFEPNSWSHSPALRWLSLHANRLQSLPSGSFKALSRLEELILSGNSIDSLHKTAMTGLDNLHRLDLSSNTLAVCVEDGAVLYNTSMPYLKSLRFTNNQLRVIPNRAFERFPALEELDLSENPIATINQGAFEPLNLKQLIMNSSSILCDCQISWFAGWLYESKLDRSTVVAKCLHPPPLQYLDVVAIDSSNLTCVDDSPRARIISQPEDVQTHVKGSARFTCTGYGQGPLTIEWRVIEKTRVRILVQDTATLMNVNTTAVINGTMDGHELAAGELILDEVTLTDRAEYQCVVRNRFGADFSKSVLLEVLQPPSFIHEPDDMALLVGHNAKFMCAATGLPRPTLKWAFDGGAFPAAEERRLYVIPNDDHIYIMNVTMQDQGVYTCHASNSAGHIQASATLRVFKNTFHSTMKDKTVVEGDAVTLECAVDLIPGIQRMIWRKDGSEIRPHNSIRTRLTSNGQTLMLEETHQSDSGEYTCELWTGGAQLASQIAHIQVIPLEEGSAQTSSLTKATHRWSVLRAEWKLDIEKDANFVVLALFGSSFIFLIFGGISAICVWIRRRTVPRRSSSLNLSHTVTHIRQPGKQNRAVHV